MANRLKKTLSSVFNKAKEFVHRSERTDYKELFKQLKQETESYLHQVLGEPGGGND